MRHLDNLVVKNGFFAGIVCAALIFGLGWTGWVVNPLRQGRLRVDENVENAAAMLNQGFDRAERTAHGLRALWDQDPVNSKDPSRMASIQPFLDRTGLEINVILAKVDGETLFIVHTPVDWHMILIPPGRTHSTVFRPHNGKWVAVEPAPFERTFQIRERPWYQQAATSILPAWTPYYTFTPISSGCTFVVPVREGGALKGVVGVDVTLSDLDRRVKELLPPAQYQVLLTDDSGRVLVDTTKPAAASSLAAASPEVIQAFQKSGPFHYQRSFPFRAQDPGMVLRVAVAPKVLIPELSLRIWIVSLAAGLTFAAIMSYVQLLNRKLVRPIRNILNRATPGRTPSEIWEFRQFEDSLLRLGQTESDRQQILQQLEHAQRVETMGNMAPGVIHDLNNHLTVILAQLNLCKEDAEGETRFQARLAKAERATMRCANAMRGLLQFSRSGPSQPVDFDLNEIVQDSVTLLEPVLKETIRMDKDLAEGLPPLQGEPIKLQQVLVNLALNGRDAMRGCGTLTFRTWQEGPNACLEVRDTGCGMTEDVKSKLFEPFYTTKAPGQGTGLGLTMVQRIILAHKGTISVASVPGEGTRFLIRLPLVASWTGSLA